MKYKYEKHITIGHDADDKPIRKRIYANTKAELEQKISEARNTQPQTKANDITFGEYSEQWYKLYKSTREAATREMYRHALKRCESLKNIPVKDLRSADLQQIIAKNVSHPSSCAKITLTLRQICALAVSEGILSSDISEPLETPSVCVKRGRAITDAEKKAVR